MMHTHTHTHSQKQSIEYTWILLTADPCHIEGWYYNLENMSGLSGISLIFNAWQIHNKIEIILPRDVDLKGLPLENDDAPLYCWFAQNFVITFSNMHFLGPIYLPFIICQNPEIVDRRSKTWHFKRKRFLDDILENPKVPIRMQFQWRLSGSFRFFTNCSKMGGVKT